MMNIRQLDEHCCTQFQYVYHESGFKPNCEHFSVSLSPFLPCANDLLRLFQRTLGQLRSSHF